MKQVLIPSKAHLRMDEVIKALGCSEPHVRHLIETGVLDAIDIRTPGASQPALRITRESLEKFIEERRV